VTLPNVITLFRLILVPLTIGLMLERHFAAAFWVFITAGISDALDGFIARRFDMRSELGAILDPVADKALLVSVYVTFGVMAVLPAWLVILVVARDIMILGGFVIIGLVGPTPAVNPLLVSKANTALQIALAALMLVRLGFGLALEPLSEILVVLVAASTLASGAAYLVQWSRNAGKEGERR
jgi:cardiolipin synthase